MEFRITRTFENDNIIIYKRMFKLDNCCGDKRYFEYDKKKDSATGKQFRSITQVKKYLATYTEDAVRLPSIVGLTFPPSMRPSTKEFI